MVFAIIEEAVIKKELEKTNEQVIQEKQIKKTDNSRK